MTRYYLGVDGGGTNCRIRLADENLRTLGEGRGGPSNLQIQNGDPAYSSILEGAQAAFAAAGLTDADYAITHACFCMAGGRSVIDRDAFAMRPWTFASVRAYDDIDAAHAGALGGDEGAVIIAGTGSAALAIVDGQRHQCGGWGFHVGDQMSGAILGRELIRRAVEATDGLVSGSPLTTAVVQALGGNLDSVMEWSFPKPTEAISYKDHLGKDIAVSIGQTPKAYGDFTRMIFDFYEKGDPIAHELIELELGYIDNYVRWFKARGATRMAATGGLGERLYDILVERYGRFIVKPLGDNLSGAVILARQNFAA
ncbi:MAG: BadF/BadG/BcrA/BcrD ATPase family protein [Devosia sp.]